MAASMTEREAALAAFIRETTWVNLPPEVREWALMCLMDNVASALAGSTARATRIAESLAEDLLPGDQGRFQGVDATTAASLSAGVSKASVLRGLVFS